MLVYRLKLSLYFIYLSVQMLVITIQKHHVSVCVCEKLNEH